MDSNHQRELAKFMAEVSVYVYRHFGVTDKSDFLNAWSIAFDAANNALTRSAQTQRGDSNGN